MQIRVGYEMIYDCPQPTPMILVLNIHYSRVSDIVVPDHLVTSPSVPITPYRDGFGNWCSRHRGAAGRMRLVADGTVRDSGLPDVIVPSACAARGGGAARGDPGLPAGQPLLRDRPAVRHRLEAVRQTPPGWARVQAICDFVHQHIAFGYEHARRDQDRLGGLQRAQGRLPRLRPPGDRASAAA